MNTTTMNETNAVLAQYQTSLKQLLGYQQAVYKEKIDLSRAKNLLATLKEDQSTLTRDALESRVVSVTDLMGLERSAVSEYVRHNGQVNTVYVSCLLDVLQVAVNDYHTRFDKAA